MGLFCQAQSLGETATARHGHALALFQPAQCKQEMKGLEFPCGKGTELGDTLCQGLQLCHSLWPGSEGQILQQCQSSQHLVFKPGSLKMHRIDDE